MLLQRLFSQVNWMQPKVSYRLSRNQRIVAMNSLQMMELAHLTTLTSAVRKTPHQGNTCWTEVCLMIITTTVKVALSKQPQGSILELSHRHLSHLIKQKTNLINLRRLIHQLFRYTMALICLSMTKKINTKILTCIKKLKQVMTDQSLRLTRWTLWKCTTAQ